jgi:hypothetical protein
LLQVLCGTVQLVIALIQIASPASHHIHDLAAKREWNIYDRLKSLKQSDRFKLDESCELS